MKAVLHHDASAHLRALAKAASGRLGIVVVAPGDEAALKREMADAEILLHVLTPVTAAVIDAAPRLRLIQKIGVGVDAIDRVHAAARGIAVCNMPGTNTPAVAEMTLTLIFACLRRVAFLSERLQREGTWAVPAEVSDGFAELGGRTVGLIGHGGVARRLVPVLTALGATVIATNRAGSARRDGAVELMPLDELLARADVVSLHLPASAETRNLIDARRIGLMKPGAVLVNTARGSLVDEAALADALRSGRIAAAGLDVFAEEPPAAGHPLLALPNVVATPHIAWLTRETLARSMEVVVENARRLGAGEALLHQVPRP